MIIHWLSPLVFETPAGKLHVISGMIEGDCDFAFDGGRVGKLLRDMLDSRAGDKRTAWGEISYQYARHRMGATDVLMASAAVLVNKGRKSE